MLAVRSAYFKEMLVNHSNQGPQDSVYLDYAIEVVEPVVTFILTGTFGLRRSIDSVVFMRMTEVIRLLQPSESELLKDAIGNFLRSSFLRVSAGTDTRGAALANFS